MEDEELESQNGRNLHDEVVASALRQNATYDPSLPRGLREEREQGWEGQCVAVKVS